MGWLIACAGCKHFTSPRELAPGASHSGAPLAGDLFTHGDCNRFPQSVRKKPDDHCGEFAPRVEGDPYA
jgi:hypothetical protein